MTKRQMMYECLSGIDTPMVPYSIKFTVEALCKMKQHFGQAFDPIIDTGSFVVASHTNNGWQEVRPGYWRDYFGVIWNKTSDKTLGVVEQSPIQDYDFANYQFPDTDNLPVYDFIREDKIKYPEHFHMISIGFTLFERAWTLIGMEALMIGFYTEQVFIHKLLSRITDYNVQVIKNAAAIGVDCVHFGDDWGQQHGPLIDPSMWRDFIKPYFLKTCNVAKECGLLISLHSCGDVSEFIPDMIECGVDVFDPFQPEAMDIWALREQYRDDIAFWGGLSVQQVLPYGSTADVERETKRLLNEMAPGGRYILSPSHSVSGDVPMENIQAFLNAARQQCAPNQYL